VNPQSDMTIESPAAVLARLCERAAHVAADDLVVLAQMHGACESLTKLWQDRTPGGDRLAGRASGVMKQLEQVILGEAADAAITLAGIAAELAELSRLVESPAETVPATPANAPASEVVCAPRPSVPLVLKEQELDFVRSFVEEAAEHIEAIEAALLEVERTPTDLTRVNDLFRPFHTIKGAAGFLNLADIISVTHEAETLLDQARKGERAITPGIIDLVFDVVDILKAQMGGIAAYLSNPTGGPVPQPSIADIVEKLKAVVANRLDPQSRLRPESSVQRTGEILVDRGAVQPEVVDLALQVQAAEPGRKTGHILMDMGVTTSRQVAQALRAQTTPAGDAAPASANPADQSVRIDTAKLDTLVDMVGELVIAQTLVTASPQVAGDIKLNKDVGQVAKILRNLQEVTLAMRMIPIRSTFQKMARLVRDVARKAGKNVELTISGEDTELDKNVIQEIGDPLVHMVRNAVDHGIEAPSLRLAAGKSETGQVHLGACHQGGNIVIEIRDDGKGLDAKRLIAKGIEKGLLQPGAELTDPEAFALIFAPGFSTAEQVTDISGRGVGMDVVKRNIDKLRGKVEISSESGRSTTFRIRLPLTLAIIDGMIVRVASQRFIVPTVALHQALRPVRGQITTVKHRGEMIQARGQLIPLIQLGQAFGLSGRVDPCAAMVVIANSDGAPVGLVVDELIGQQQVVIKSLGTQFEGLRGVSGAAILGDGRVGLILETTGLAALRARGAADRN
jgi:two-component system, chemotaxis family, sensor kinase CheA